MKDRTSASGLAAKTPLLCALSRLNGVLIKAAGGITILAMAIMAIVIPYEVAGRYLLAAMPSWSGEAATFSLVWLSMMGSAVGLKKGYQISLTTIVDRLPDPAAGIVRGCSLCLMLVLLLIMTWYGLQQTLINLPQVSPALEVSMALPYAALPAGFGLMVLITIEDLAGMFLLSSEDNSTS
jgi:TRAP-type C4-dicarboxylate transport system permease small subunit